MGRLALYLENTRKIVAKRELLVEEAMETAFKSWYYECSDKEGMKFLPAGMSAPTGMAIKESKFIKTSVQKYFTENIWLTLRGTIEKSELL